MFVYWSFLLQIAKEETTHFVHLFIAGFSNFSARATIDIGRIGWESRCYKSVYGNGSHEKTATTYQWPRAMSKITEQLFGRQTTCVSKVQFTNGKHVSYQNVLKRNVCLYFNVYQKEERKKEREKKISHWEWAQEKEKDRANELPG